MKTIILDEEKKAVLVSVLGDLDASHSPTLLRELESLIEQGTVNIVLDLTQIKFVSSSGIAVLAASGRDISQKQGKLSVVCTNQTILSLFDITNLDRLISIYKTLEEAKACFHS